jgi:hypothetical protein
MFIKIVGIVAEKVMVKLEPTDVNKNKNAFSNQEGIFIFLPSKTL